MKFTDDALKEIAKQAYARNTGARALRSVVEDFMMEVMYELPDMKHNSVVTITQAIVTEHFAKKKEAA